MKKELVVFSGRVMTIEELVEKEVKIIDRQGRGAKIPLKDLLRKMGL